MECVPIEKAVIYARVELITKEARYAGTIVRFDKKEGKIVLKDVEMLDNDATAQISKSIVGDLCFARDDIIDVKVLDAESLMQKMDPHYLLMKPFHKPSHLRGQKVPTDIEILQMGRPSAETGSTNSTIPEAFLPKMPETVIIDALNENFSTAICILKQQKWISVAAEGVKLSRNGELCWLAIAYGDRIFLFDILSLHSDAFKNGLGEIFQSEAIVKIMHDCRFLSDYLFHKHGIQLQSVWDTQVATIIVFQKKHGGDLPAFVEPLIKTLQDTLGVDPNTFPMLWYRSYALEEDQAVWRERPLSDELRTVLIGAVIFLRDLRSALVEKMLFEFSFGCETYLKIARNARDSSVDRMTRNRLLIPGEFLTPFRMLKERYVDDGTSSVDSITGCREAVGRLNFAKLRFSRDSWHGEIGGKSSANNLKNLPEKDEDELD